LSWAVDIDQFGNRDRDDPLAFALRRLAVKIDVTMKIEPPNVCGTLHGLLR